MLRPLCSNCLRNLVACAVIVLNDCETHLEKTSGVLEDAGSHLKVASQVLTVELLIRLGVLVEALTEKRIW